MSDAEEAGRAIGELPRRVTAVETRTLYNRGKQHPCNLYKGEDQMVWAQGYARGYRVGALEPAGKRAGPYLPGSPKDDLWHLGYFEACHEIRNSMGDREIPDTRSAAE